MTFTVHPLNNHQKNTEISLGSINPINKVLNEHSQLNDHLTNICVAPFSVC